MPPGAISKASSDAIAGSKIKNFKLVVVKLTKKPPPIDLDVRVSMCLIIEKSQRALVLGEDGGVEMEGVRGKEERKRYTIGGGNEASKHHIVIRRNTV